VAVAGRGFSKTLVFESDSGRCKILTDCVKTLAAAAPAVSIRVDALSEFSELAIRFEKDLSNAGHSPISWI